MACSASSSRAQARYRAKKKQEKAEGEVNVPQLDTDLIRRANAAGTFIDYGDAGVREYNKLTSEIKSMDMTASEKTQTISKLHSLMTNQLEAESKALTPYSMGVGPARFNSNKMSRSEDKATNARAEVSKFMNELKQEQERKVKEREKRELTNAYNNAIEKGLLEFTVNGKTWRRKTKRAKSFTAN